MIKRLCLLLFCIAWSPCVCLSETLVSCPQSDSCNISIYKSSNSTIFGSHNITLISPKDDQGNNLPLSSSCAEPFFFIEERNRCESTETACSSEGVFNPLTHTCETGTICGSTGGTLDSALGTCRKYPDCDLGGTFNPDPESMWCEADVIADYSCPAGDFREVNGEGRCEISPHCIEPGVYNTSTGLCEVTVTTQCPDGGSFSQEHNQCEATASSHMCYTNHSMQMCYAWSAVHNPYNLPTRDDCFMDFVGACFYYVFVNGECREVFNAYQNLNENTCLASHDTCTDSGGQTYPARWEPARLSCPGSPSMDCFPWPAPPECPGNVPPDDATFFCERNASTAQGCEYTTSCSGLSGNFYSAACRLVSYWNTHSCPSGYTWDGFTCSSPASIDTCPLGYSQIGNLCYRDPDPCPLGWTLDTVSGGSNLCYMTADASFSCPPEYTLLEITGENYCLGTAHCFGNYTLNNTTHYCESDACPEGYYFDHGVCNSDEICSGAAQFDPDNQVCYFNITGNIVHIEYDGVTYSVPCDGTEQVLGNASVARDCPFPLEWDGNYCSGNIQCNNGTYDPYLKLCTRDTLCESSDATLESSLGICRKYPDCEQGGLFNTSEMRCKADVISNISCPSGIYREVDGEGICEQQPTCLSPSIYNPSTGLCEFTIGAVCPPGGSLESSGLCVSSIEENYCYTETSEEFCYTWHSAQNLYNLPTRDDCFMDFVGACFYYVFVNGECREVFNAYQNLNENTCLASHDTCTDSGGQTYPARWEPARLSCPGSPSMDCFPYPSSACPGNNPPNNSTIVCERNASPSRSCDYTTSCSGLSGNFSKSRCRLATYWLYEVCPEGYTANGSSCTAQPSYQTCPNGFMQDETLCYRNPDPCPPEWSFDNVDAGTNLCYMYVQASYSCPTNYDLTEIDGEYHCIGVPFCRNAGYTFNNTSRYCESPACSISYSYNPSGICTSGNLCPPSAIFDPDNNLCYLNIEVDEVESSPEDIANTIICTISENGDSINATLNLYDQEAYDYPYANAPGYGIDPSLDGTNRDNPVCVHDDIHRTDACKWQRYNDDNEWLNDMGVPLNSWIIYGNTLVHSLTLGYLVDSNTGFSEDDNICARDINEDGNITENEIMMCLETPQGGLCPIELAECEVSTTPIVCPGNGTWDPDRNRCWKATTDDNLLCRIGSWVPEHNQCEATIECPAAAGHTPAYNNEHDICEYPITCPDNGTWHNTRDVCELMPVCNTTLNGNRPSYNVGAQRCETPITTEYNCPAGALKYVRNGTTICTRLPLCNTGDSYVCRNHRCERAATPVCPSGHTLENNRCYMSAELDNCYTEREVTRLTSSRVYRLCARAYDRCSKSCPSWSWDEPITCRICDNYGEWYGGGINNLPSACQGTTTETICRLSNECSPFGGTWSRAGTYGYAMEPPTCYARDSYGERTGPRCQGNSRPSRSISVGVDQYPYVTMIGKNTGALVCYYKEFWGVYTCPSGYTLDGNRCWRQPNYTCPSGYTLSGNICYRAPSCSTYGSGWAFDSSLNPDSACPTGYGLCWTNSTPVTVCPTGYTIDGSLCTHYSDHSCPSTTYRFSTSTGMCQYSGFGCTGSYALDTVFNVCGFSDVCPEGTNHDVVNDVCASSRICVDPYELSTAENLCLSFEYSCPTYYHVDLIDDICYHDWPDLCPYGTEYTCMNNNGLWQCSPHICDAFNNVLEDTDTIEGENDIKEIGFEEDGSCAGEIYIFRGFDKRCRTSGTTTSYVNCCGTASSDECINNLWLGLQPCNAREKDLACRKTANLCIEVGEYCSKRIKLLSGSSCIEHKKTYCCFGSKFGRVLQEQGRPLLKDFDPAAPFGTPENPNCDGFTPEQFSLLEWEEIDLTELYPDIEVMPMKDFEDSVNTRFQNQLNNFKLPGQ